MDSPGIEPGSSESQSEIVPFNHEPSIKLVNNIYLNNLLNQLLERLLNVEVLYFTYEKGGRY